MKARVEYTCDYYSKNGDDQHGRIIVTPEDGSGGQLQATWRCCGGMGEGAELVENTTNCWTSEEAEEIVDSTEICQGYGIYNCEIVTDEKGWLTVENVEFVD